VAEWRLKVRARKVLDTLGSFAVAGVAVRDRGQRVRDVFARWLEVRSFPPHPFRLNTPLSSSCEEYEEYENYRKIWKILQKWRDG
jgi:hypothetical protein